MKFLRICILFLFLASSGCSLRRKSVIERRNAATSTLAPAAAQSGARAQEVAAPTQEDEMFDSARYAHKLPQDKGEDVEPDLRPRPRMPRSEVDETSQQKGAKGRRGKPLSVNEHMVKIDFDNEDLATMLNHFAALQKRNLVLPQGPDALNQKITFKLQHEIPLRAVDKYLDMFLELAGHSRVPYGSEKGPDGKTTVLLERIVRNDGAVVREPLPLYIGIDPKDLPNSDERIRTIYYLKNLRVPDNENGAGDPITAILLGVLSASRSLTYDPRANAIIIADKANAIRAAMTMILDLDALGSKDIIRAMPLYNTSATMVADIITKQVMAVGGEEQGPGAKGDSGRYFSPGLRIMPDTRTNALIIMGREPAVERVQEFIREYIDVPTDTGDSVLHFYELQYLDAKEFAAVLDKVVKEQLGLSGQATQQAAGGPVKYFDNVVVVAEQYVAEKSRGGGGVSVSGQTKSAIQSATAGAVLQGDVYRGGNRIVVTALKDDWRRIENLIRQLDQPRLQVLVQVLVVDLAVTDNEILATQLRNPEWMQLPPGFAFQSAQAFYPIADGPVVANSSSAPTPFTYTNPTTVAADLLRLLAGSPQASAAALIANTPATIGSMILSINDPSARTPGIWAFMQWLETFFTTKVLQHPYIVVQNYAQGEEYVSTIVRLPGPAATGEGGAISTKIVDIPAAIRVGVVPRASSADRLNLQISITIDQFVGTAGARATRQLHTNVNLNNGDILVLGGLTSYQENWNESETPVLGSIPIIKWFFSKNSKSLARNNLVAFVTPTIIEPRSPAGMNAFTVDETHRNYKIMKQDQLLSQLKDPISYLFFQDRNDDLAEMLDEYLAVGKGDFVYDDLGAVANPSTRKCSPCKPTDKPVDEKKSCQKACVNTSPCSPGKKSVPPCKQQALTADDAERIKQQFADEENPLLVNKK